MASNMFGKRGQIYFLYSRFDLPCMTVRPLLHYRIETRAGKIYLSPFSLIHGAGRQGHAFDLHALREVVETNDKRRFTLSDDGRRIRAAQGHSSAQVEVRHVAKTPPALLYHGTASRFLASIEAQGLIPGSRHHVHLSEDPQTALAVGKRYGQPVLLTVDTQAMCAAGTVFYQADNGVWLVDQVPPTHLSRQAL